MKQIKPFLTHFAEEKTVLEGIKHKLNYNEELDYNEIQIIQGNNEIDLNSLSTITRVKSEAPDVIEMTINQIEYLAAKTITEIKSEKPDYMDPISNSVFLNTKTFTKSVGEQADLKSLV